MAKMKEEYYVSLTRKLLYEILVEFKETSADGLTYSESVNVLIDRHDALTDTEKDTLRKQYKGADHILDSFIKRDFVRICDRVDFFVEKGTDRISSVVYN